MKFRTLTPVIIGLLFPTGAVAAVRDYGADEHHSRWTVVASPLACQLRHAVPRYGEAVFAKEAGGELGFSLYVFQQPRRSGEARLLSVPPAWKHGATVRDLGTVDYADRQPPFRVPTTISRRLLAELEQGMFPTLTFNDWADGSDQVKVHLSAVNVRDALAEFQTCLRDVVPFTFEAIRHSRLHFEFGKADLTPEARDRLDDIARYVRADSSVRRIELAGHTDNVGFRTINRRLSARRAEAVKAYLIAQGVDSALFKVQGYGERRPLASNRSPEGRAENRRVEIHLIR